jgi:uncharacterized protein YidB (DUF937 family)
MSLFDEAKKKISSLIGAMKGEHPRVIEAIMAMATNKESGGLTGLLASFKEKGMGDIVSSWVSTGKNLPITPEQVQEGLGTERINQFAQQTGMSPDAAKSKLAELLPEVVDKLTPEGKIPETELTGARK